MNDITSATLLAMLALLLLAAAIGMTIGHRDCVAWGYDGTIVDGTVLFCFRLCDCPETYMALPYQVAKLQFERSVQLLPACAANSG